MSRGKYSSSSRELIWKVPLPWRTTTRAIALLRLPVAWTRASASSLTALRSSGSSATTSSPSAASAWARSSASASARALLLGGQRALGLERDRLEVGAGGGVLGLGLLLSLGRALVLSGLRPRSGRQARLGLGAPRRSPASASASSGGSVTAGSSGASGVSAGVPRLHVARRSTPRRPALQAFPRVRGQPPSGFLNVVLLLFVGHQASTSIGLGCCAWCGCSGPA